MVRISDGRVGVSVNAETMKVLDEVRKAMREQLGINASYTQAIQYIANQYIKDTVTASHTVQQGE
jgi:hypothetical protein